MKVQKSKRSYLPYILVILVLAIFAQAVFSFFLWRTSRSTSDDLKLVLNHQFLQEPELFEAQPAVDAGAKRLYLPGLNLYLPLTTGSLDLSYRVTDANGGGTPDLVFTSKLNRTIYQQSNGNYQCWDVMRVEIGAEVAQPRENEVSTPPFKLADGRQVFPYLFKSYASCPDGMPAKPAQVEAIVRQLQSY